MAPAREAVLTLLSNTPEQGLRYSEIVKQSGYPDKTVFEVLNYLQKQDVDHVKKSNEGKYFITGKGSKALEASLSTSVVEELAQVDKILAEDALAHLRTILDQFMQGVKFAYPHRLKKWSDYQERYDSVIHYGSEMWSLTERLVYNLKHSKKKQTIEFESPLMEEDLPDNPSVWLSLKMKQLDDAVQRLDAAGLPKFSRYLRMLVQHMKDSFNATGQRGGE